MKVHNFFGLNIVTSFLVEVVMVIVINVAHATASATIANYPLLLYMPCPQDLLPSLVSTSAQRE
jgi:hypothetical protein